MLNEFWAAKQDGEQCLIIGDTKIVYSVAQAEVSKLLNEIPDLEEVKPAEVMQVPQMS